jgi:hypothetical protein
MSFHSGVSNTDGPLTVSSGIDAASFKPSLGSEILEILLSSTYGLGHDLLPSHPQPSDPSLTLLPDKKGLRGS